jgi:membrane protein implicated in regulation of membrane protease activity
MSDRGWKQSLLQGIGNRIEVMAELYPRAYLSLTTFLALTGFACLAMFPLLVLAGVAGMYRALVNAPGIAWSLLLAWALVAVFCGLVTYRIIRFRPRLPAGVALERGQAPDLFGLVEDTAEQYGRMGVDRILITGGYQLDLIKTPRTALPAWSSCSLVIGLPLMQCLSSEQFGCQLVRRLGQFSKRTNPLLNWLFELRDIWPRYRSADAWADPAFLPVHLLFSVFAPVYTAVSTPAARLDELQADRYAVELCGDEEVLETITTDAVNRLFLHERYWPAIRKLGARKAAVITKTNTGIVRVLYAGLQDGNIEEWTVKAMSMEQQWNDPRPLLAQRLDNIGHVHARMQARTGESAAEDYLPASGQPLRAALDKVMPPPRPELQPWPVRMAGLKRRLQSAIHSLDAGEVSR